MILDAVFPYARVWREHIWFRLLVLVEAAFFAAGVALNRFCPNLQLQLLPPLYLGLVITFMMIVAVAVRYICEERQFPQAPIHTIPSVVMFLEWGAAFVAVGLWVMKISSHMDPLGGYIP